MDSYFMTTSSFSTKYEGEGSREKVSQNHLYVEILQVNNYLVDLFNKCWVT